MSDELPIYSDSVFRGPNPFPALDDIREGEVEECIDRLDRFLDYGEGGRNAGAVLAAMTEPTRQSLLELHARIFEERQGAGQLRESAVTAVFPGQDCPEPRFIAPSLETFEKWLQVESITELHPIQQTALSLVRLVDIWPFEFGNRTVAAVFSNFFLLRAGYPPFRVPASQMEEFDQTLSKAVRMQTEGLVRAIYASIERELAHVRR